MLYLEILRICVTLSERRNQLYKGCKLFNRPFLLSSFLGVLLAISSAEPAAIRVPADQPTIQAGIIAAIDGDTVLVADGTYTGTGNKRISFMGKAITVRSENGAEKTILNCENDGRGFTFKRQEARSSVLEGFTIINGNSTEGGGLYCFHASPTISECTIHYSEAILGGGIYCASSSLLINDCTISNNHLKAVESACGGGLCIIS